MEYITSKGPRNVGNLHRMCLNLIKPLEEGETVTIITHDPFKITRIFHCLSMRVGFKTIGYEIPTPFNSSYEEFNTYCVISGYEFKLFNNGTTKSNKEE